MSYRVFRRAWFAPDGETPHPNASKTLIAAGLKREEARKMCIEYNDGPRTPYQIKRGIKYELEEE